MKLVDTNVWLALALKGHQLHRAAMEWFGHQRGEGTVLFCRPTQTSFLRLLTTAAAVGSYGLPQPLTNAAAITVLNGLFESAKIGFVEEPPGIDPIWHTLAARETASPKLWMDAYLAAFAIVGAYQWVTGDKAFAQFDGLNVELITA